MATEECANVYTFIIHSLNMQLFTQAFTIIDTRLIHNYSHSINLNSVHFFHMIYHFEKSVTWRSLLKRKWLVGNTSRYCLISLLWSINPQLMPPFFAVQKKRRIESTAMKYPKWHFLISNSNLQSSFVDLSRDDLGCW